MEGKINGLRQDARTVVRELGLLNDAYFEIGVTLAERHLLIELSLGPITAKEIAERLLLDKSTVSRLIARAEKKGYVSSTLDTLDKRKRILKLTSKGDRTLQAFEKIAFQQTKEALETLLPPEREIVHRGVALYAEGLKNVRKGISIDHPIETLSEIKKALSPYQIELYQKGDEEALYEIYQETIREGNAFIWGSSKEEFQTYFLHPQAIIYVLRASTGEVFGSFYIKPNFPGRASHIANAGYMVKASHQGKGLGKWMVKASLHLAKKHQFRAMQFNIVLSCNDAAMNLYRRIGFSIIGTLPEAVMNQDGSYQDAYILYRSLGDLV